MGIGEVELQRDADNPGIELLASKLHPKNKAIYSQYYSNGKLVRVSSSCTAATLAVLCLEQKNQGRNFDYK